MQTNSLSKRGSRIQPSTLVLIKEREKKIQLQLRRVFTVEYNKISLFTKLPIM